MTEMFDRRVLLKLAVGATVSGGLAFPSIGSERTHKHRNSVDSLDTKTYISGMKLHGLFPDLNIAKVQMMSIGSRRFLFSRRTIIDVTNALEPKIVSRNAYLGGQDQLAYNRVLRKWILITNAQGPLTLQTDEKPLGKYAHPRLTMRALSTPGLRGIRIYDATDPYSIKLLGEMSSDGLDPKRPIQTGSGSHRNTYDGGRYAFLSAAPDNRFSNNESPDFLWSSGLQIVDLEDPTNPKIASNFWFPGQRDDEEDAYRLWRESGDRKSFMGSHGPFYTMKPVEEGGHILYCAFGGFGACSIDVSDPKNPKLLGRFETPYLPGAIPVHALWPAWLEKRGLMLTGSEPFDSDCAEPLIPNYVLDWKDVKNPKSIAEFGNWEPPTDAPYKDFCDARGRKGTHNPPHWKAPGIPHPTWCPFSAFNAGLQAVDFSDPLHPRSAGYFLPQNKGDLANPRSYTRHGEAVFVEWDRGLIWFGSNAGLALLSHPALGRPNFEPTAVSRWAMPHFNRGAPS